MERKKAGQKPPPDAAGDAKAIFAALHKGFHIMPGTNYSLVNGIPDETSLGLQRTLVANPYFDVDMDGQVGTADLLLALSMMLQESLKTGSVRSFHLGRACLLPRIFLVSNFCCPVARFVIGKL